MEGKLSKDNEMDKVNEILFKQNGLYVSLDRDIEKHTIEIDRNCKKKLPENINPSFIK